MPNKLITLLFLSLFSLTIHANITATVVKYKGDVLYNGKQITRDTLFVQNGLIEVKQNGYLQMKVKEYNSTFTLGPNSVLKIKFKKNIKNSPYLLKEGFLRWVTRGKSKVKGFVRTKTASLAVRGTDFLVTVSSLLGETEVYCFSGKVLFQNRKSREDNGVVKRNDWGGLGGRFGATVGDIVPMTQKQINHVKSLLE
ncbi:hypothetical protein A9Q84_13480 [Halobacteriovorax marinus]|uniref:FecR protein domain-containing protein n=1 Tax=Halobacteriovorax marinus TaxID=97084 RepID=A0A1Y5FEK8_9BACT|nr:hypothetical protein A9Q84_13480 [Halobacteriovorax marinus]